jgi:hypothetical protein
MASGSGRSQPVRAALLAIVTLVILGSASHVVMGRPIFGAAILGSLVQLPGLVLLVNRRLCWAMTVLAMSRAWVGPVGGVQANQAAPSAGKPAHSTTPPAPCDKVAGHAWTTDEKLSSNAGAEP